MKAVTFSNTSNAVSTEVVNGAVPLLPNFAYEAAICSLTLEARYLKEETVLLKEASALMSEAIDLMGASNQKMIRVSQLKEASKNFHPTIADLERASQDDKEKLLYAMPVVPVPICAAYLGILEDDVYSFAAATSAEFGARYQGAWCYSLDELLVFAKYPTWFPRLRGTKPRNLDYLPPRIMAEYGTLIGADIAGAYLGMTVPELNTHFAPAGHPRRPYRLFDIKVNLRRRDYPLRSKRKAFALERAEVGSVQ